jgi:hypothetical protein
MNEQDHALGLGKLMGNLQSLEATLRIFLTRADRPKNYMTEGTLGQLVKKYNRDLSKDERSLYRVNKSIVKVRNALAHGLIFPSDMRMPLPLTLLHKNLQFQMTMEWFEEQQALVRDQINRIVDYAKKRGLRQGRRKR